MRKIGWNFQISVYHGGQHSCLLFNDPRKCFFFTSISRYWLMKTLIYAMDSVIISFMYDFINAIFLATSTSIRFTGGAYIYHIGGYTFVVLTLRTLIWKIWILGDCDIFSIINNVEGTGQTWYLSFFLHKCTFQAQFLWYFVIFVTNMSSSPALP